MGAVPKSKVSQRRRGNRRSHNALTRPHLVICPKCGRPARPHSVCLECGTYKGMSVIQVEEE
ncbi:MAG: 50S ribosomal protein L32 [Chloroflexia bacterium]|nr:50S ribosomal protein L32 [Chloroflexia bacterium]